MESKYFYVIYNPVAGSGTARAVWKIVSAALAEQGVAYEIYESQYPRHTVQLAQQIALGELKPNSVLLVMGGDGTLNEAITGLHLSGNPQHLPVAYIPAGSGNDFARGIGLSQKPLVALKQVLEATEPLHLDVGTYTELVSGKRGYFVNNFGIGFDAAVVTAANAAASKHLLNHVHMGALAYIAQVVHVLARRRSFTITVTANGKTETIKDAYLCTTTNHPYFGGGVRILPEARPDDGLLDLIVVDRPNLFAFASQALQSIAGRPVGKSTARHHFKSDHIEISTPTKQFAQIDGETMAEQNYHVEFGLTEQDFWIKPDKNAAKHAIKN
ncbi:diacylglycerol/lipid kinase family protein [Lacticaseibacillus zhaodongensis]|uniref:diacylglycerol/lipid kinase family protein n=1 Tax=Lacticaseibacillus zhaodongensis TaxID=2668065 RepID=UPI0012D2D96A|nr:diacylglycerol kinase family protein [Lacticaseibacillus zhaodongensis]